METSTAASKPRPPVIKKVCGLPWALEACESFQHSFYKDEKKSVFSILERKL